MNTHPWYEFHWYRVSLFGVFETTVASRRVVEKRHPHLGMSVSFSPRLRKAFLSDFFWLWFSVQHEIMSNHVKSYVTKIWKNMKNRWLSDHSWMNPTKNIKTVRRFPAWNRSFVGMSVVLPIFRHVFTWIWCGWKKNRGTDHVGSNMMETELHPSWKCWYWINQISDHLGPI